MHHQFFVLFASIILILLALLVVETVAFTCGKIVVERNWKNHVFDEFLSQMQDVLEFLNKDELQEQSLDSGVFSLMFDSLSERISGCMLRDADGKYVVSFGATPMGVMMPTPRKKVTQELLLKANEEPRLRVNYQDMVLYLERSVDSPGYCLEIISDPANIIGNAELVKLEKGPRTMVYLPEIVNNQDIAGTVMISVDGEVKGYLDVLVYTMNSYHPTDFIYRQLAISMFCFAFPLALVIAVILAFGLSRKSEKEIRRIQKYLEAIATGNYDIKMGKQGIVEYDAILMSINQLAEDLKRHQRARKEWIRNISHDLNTPVTSLSIMVNGVIDGVFPANDALLGQLKSEIETLSARISSVSYFSQLLYPEAKPDIERLSVSEVMDEVLQKGNYDFLVPEETYILYADRAMLLRALSEVMLNAAEYGDKTEKPFVRYEDKKGRLVIEIHNKGSLPKPLPSFFEPWARGDSARNSAGSGLGLPIVAQIMELHGGNVTIREESGYVVVRMSFPPNASPEA